MKMPYRPTLFQASRMAAEQLLALAHHSECAVPCRYSRAGLQQPVSNCVQAFGWANFILYNWLELAQQAHELPHENAVSAHIISSQQNGCQAASCIGPS